MRSRDVKPNTKYLVKNVPEWMEKRYAPEAYNWEQYIGKTIKTVSDEDGSLGVVSMGVSQGNIPCCALEPIKEEKPALTTKCAKCGKEEPLTWLLTGHKCREWRRLLYERVFTFPMFVMIGVGVGFIVASDWNLLYKFLAAIGFGMFLEIIQQYFVDRDLER